MDRISSHASFFIVNRQLRDAGGTKKIFMENFSAERIGKMTDEQIEKTFLGATVSVIEDSTQKTLAIGRVENFFLCSNFTHPENQIAGMILGGVEISLGDEITVQIVKRANEED